MTNLSTTNQEGSSSDDGVDFDCLVCLEDTRIHTGKSMQTHQHIADTRVCVYIYIFELLCLDVGSLSTLATCEEGVVRLCDSLRS